MLKILININNLKETEYYKEIGITNFLFAAPKLSIGYQCFDLSDIPDNSYILINRVLDSDTVDYLKSIKDEFKRFKGIIYEDIAVYNIFSDTDLELIWFQNHFTTNYESINYWLHKGCESAVISNEITMKEIDEIIQNSHKKLVLNVLAKNQIMYSRRHLLSNFNKHNQLPQVNDCTLDTINNETMFFARESEYGTVIYNNTYFNYIKLMPKYADNIKFFLVLNLDMSPEKIKNILEGEEFGDEGFLNKKTVYKMAEYM